jgi:hypothetical protein
VTDVTQVLQRASRRLAVVCWLLWWVRYRHCGAGISTLPTQLRAALLMLLTLPRGLVRLLRHRRASLLAFARRPRLLQRTIRSQRAAAPV